jgi:hypothetical protein
LSATVFGALKKHLKVFLLTQEYLFATQAWIVLAVALLHNFLIIHNYSDISLVKVKAELNTDDNWSQHQTTVSREE